MIDLNSKQRVAATELQLPAMGQGCGTLGDPDVVISEDQAQQTLAAAWDGGLRYFDTAPWYGNTKSEHRVGQFLRQKPRREFVVTTKVGRVYRRPDDPESFANSPWMARWRGGLPFDLRFDYTRDGILRSYEDSLMRLGLNSVDALAIHDLDLKHQKNDANVRDALDALSDGGGYQVLSDLKARGEIKAIGVGINHTGMIRLFLERFDIDYFLVAMPYTLLDQPALDKDVPKKMPMWSSVPCLHPGSLQPDRKAIPHTHIRKHRRRFFSGFAISNWSAGVTKFRYAPPRCSFPWRIPWSRRSFPAPIRRNRCGRTSRP